MPKPNTVRISRRAAVAKGALFTYLGPRMAQDAKVDLAPVLAKIQVGKPFAVSKSDVAVALRAATKDKLAQDADIDDVAALLDAIETVVDEVPASVPEEPEDLDPDLDGDPDVVHDDEPPEMMAKVREFIKDHVDEATLAQFDQLIGGGLEPAPAPEPEDLDEDPDLDPDNDDMGRDNRMGQDRKPRFVTRGAMDEAIQQARTEERTIQRAIGAARDHVRPTVGELTIAFDSADDVYRAALRNMKVAHDGVHPSALRSVFEAHSAVRAAPRRPAGMAEDASLPAGVKPLSERIPSMRRIEVMG